MLGNISTVTTTDLITAAKFNEIQDQVFRIVGPGFYDYKGYNSHAVSTSTQISAVNWGNLHTDINQCIIHQTNQAIVTNSPQLYGIVSATFVNSLIDCANQAYINSGTISLSQIGNSTFNSTSGRLDTWNAPMEHDVKYAWITSTDAEGFFALGGYFRVHLDSAGGADLEDNNIWRQLIVDAEVNLMSTPYQFNLADWTALASGASKTVTAASYLAESVQIVYTKTNYEQLDISVKFITNSLRTIDLNIFSTVYEYYSIGGVGPEPHGYAARRPDVVTVLDLAGGQGFNEFRARPAISLSPSSMSFSGYTSSTLATQVLTITNTGNTVTNISNITASNSGGLELTVDPHVFPLAINSGSVATVNLTYSGNIAGRFLNLVTVAGDMEAGPSTIPTTVTLQYKPYDFTLSPSTLNTTITVSRTYSQQLTINSINGVFKTYSAVITSASPGFSLQTPQPLTGPVLKFNPIGHPQGTYSATVSVTVNHITHTATITYVNEIPQSSHLGDWVSALGHNNSVVGMSYDIITGNRYLTIGIGMGADGSPALDGGGSSYVNVSYLNQSGAPKYSTGIDPTLQCVLAKTGFGSPWGAFLQQYGVWVDTNYNYPNECWLVRSYTFTAPYSGTYRYQFSVDNYGYFDIDGQTILGQVGPDLYSSSLSDTFYLSAGSHTVTIHMYNAGSSQNGNPGGIGLNIFNPGTGISYWSTLDVVSSAYVYWQEAYRIPIPTDGNVRTLYNAPYAVKDVGAVNGNRWSAYFGNSSDASSGSMFAITDDGSGNLTVTLMPTNQNTGDGYFDTTLISLAYSMYYYAESSIGADRYTNLEGIQNGSQTHQFTGFTNVGDVTTVLTSYPGYNAGGGGGGGGGGSWIPVISDIGGLVGLGSGGGGGSIICTKLHELGYLSDTIYEADEKFGKYLRATDPDSYYGYLKWASTVVAWLEGAGPNIMPWIKDDAQRKQHQQELVTRWTLRIATPWAHHMAYVMGAEEQDNRAGRIIMKTGRFISRLIGKFSKSNKPSTNPAVGYILWATFGVFWLLAGIK